jgi:hypothetical protein
VNSNRLSGPAIWGIILVAVGVLLLTQTMGLLPDLGEGIVGVAFAIGGIALLAFYLANRSQWWMLIAGPALVGLGLTILTQTVFKTSGDWSGAVFLGGIGIGFLLVVVTGTERWWAVIPAGTLLTLALVAVAGSVLSEAETGAIFFFGLAATFGVLALVPLGRGTRQWAFIPAGVLAAIGLVALLSDRAAGVVWPVVLVAIGLFLLIRALRRPARPS